MPDKKKVIVIFTSFKLRPQMVEIKMQIYFHGQFWFSDSWKEVFLGFLHA